MKTNRPAFLKSVFTMIVVTLIALNSKVAFSQTPTQKAGFENDSMETLADAHTSSLSIMEDDNKMIRPKFDRSKSYKDFQEYILDKLDFPTEGVETGRSGIMKVQFEITTDGSMRNIQFIESPGVPFENKVRTVLDEAPSWTPAKRGGKNIPITYQLNIDFNLR